MEQKRENLPVKPGLLHRERLDALLEQGTRHSLVTIIAGPGYGKTYAAASFAQKWPKRLVWIRVSSLDNIASRFWRNFIRSLSEELPELGRALEGTSFPSTMIQFDTFLRRFAKELYEGEQVLLVVDDFNNLYSPELHQFFALLLESNLENFCLMLISSVRTDLEHIGLHSDEGVFRIKTEDLQLTVQETRELLSLYCDNLQPQQIQEVVEYTEGWPLATYLLALQLQMRLRGQETGAAADLYIVHQMFEHKCFTGFSKDIQQLLIKLSLFQGFSFEMIKYMDTCDLQETTDVIGQILFIQFDDTQRMFVFQKMYREFLLQKLYMIPDEEIQRVYLAAGNWFLENKHTLEAIECYGKCAQYDKMLDAIQSYPFDYMGYGAAQFLLSHLNLLPIEFLEQNPIAVHLKALVYLNNMEVDKAEQILTAMKNEYENKKSLLPNEQAILGEVYITLAALCMMDNNPGFAGYYRKAYECLPNGSRIHTKDIIYVGNANSLKMSGSQPGELERMEKLFVESVPYIEHVMNGAARGVDYLYSADAAFEIFDLPTAQEKAYQAVYKAQERDCHDIVCAGHTLLGRIAFVRGDYDELLKEKDFLVNYINKHELASLVSVRDTAEGRFYVKMRDFEHVPKWILEDWPSYYGGISPIAVADDRVVHANYLLLNGNLFELLAMLERFENLCVKRGLWTNRLIVHVFRAVTLQKIGDEGRAIDSFCQAYDMAYHNNIITPFIEAGNCTRSLCAMARRSQGHSFDAEWLDNIEQKASSFAKRLSAMQKEHAKRTKQQKPETNLSKREMDVLFSLSQGLTRDEIAGFYGVSVNTVKSNIKNIYNKLGAVNRADAVRIATMIGLVE